jgi:CubicO group peptidase (beta-lactamase class C family)
MNFLRSLLISPVGLLAVLAMPAAGQVPADANVQVDRIFEQWDSMESPGCAVGVVQHGLTVLSRAYGMADLEHNIPNTPATIFEGGSVSKQFTAAAIVLLALEGKLSLDDDVRRYVPEVPDYGTTVTLRHMLTHTSGLRDWGSVAGISGWGRQNRTHTHAHVLDIVSRQSVLNFPPGHEYSYSNTGYNLLAIIVGRVSGMSFAEFSKRHIFEPLGMENTQWRDDYTRIVKGRSTAYAVRGETVSIMRPIENVHGNGGILTTVGDLLIWNEALAHGTLGGPEFVRMMVDQGRLNDGRQIAYAAGLFVRPFAGVPSVTHTGSTSGYRAYLGRFPEQGLSVAMLCNASNVSTSGNGGRIARAFLGDAAHDPVAADGVDVPAQALSRVAGLYRDTQTGDPMRLAVVEGQLRMDGRAPMVPLSQTEFLVGSGDRRFIVRPADGPRPSILVRSGEYDDGTYEPVDEFQPSEADLRAYEGEFYSHDAETTLTVIVEEGHLEVRRRPDDSFRLSPVYSDAFTAGQLGLIRFDRDESGTVVELRLRQGRVYDMRFQRVER